MSRRGWSLLLLGALAGCDNSPRVPIDAPPVLSFGDPLACASQQLCGAGTSVPCDVDLTAALTDSALCPASYYGCGDGWSIVMKGGVDTTMFYYYQGGTLVAVTNVGLVVHACIEGPASFAPPDCDHRMSPLPGCH